MTRTIIGYHGTRLESAEQLLAGSPFRLSRNRYDWLGDGVYFWEYGPLRAMQWARQTYGDQAAVLRATIRLEHCLDMTDLRGVEDVKQAYRFLVERFERAGKPLPKQTAKGYRALDRMVVNLAAERNAPRIDTVRAAFVEGAQLWEHSGFWEMAHIQVTVRNVALIDQLALVEDVDNEAF